MQSSDLWTLDPSSGSPRWNGSLVASLRTSKHPEWSDRDVADALMTVLRSDFVEAATHDRKYQLNHEQTRRALQTLYAVAARLGIKWSLPFQDRVSFEGHWRGKGLTGSGAWSMRRGLLHDLFSPLENALAHIEDVGEAGELTEGADDIALWAEVKETEDALRRRFRDATSADDYAAVGGDAVRLLEKVAKVAYDPERHCFDGEEPFPENEVKNRLSRVAKVELDSDTMKSLINHAVTAAQAAKHRHDTSRAGVGMSADIAIAVSTSIRRAVMLNRNLEEESDDLV